MNKYFKTLGLALCLGAGSAAAYGQLSATATVDSLELTMGSKGHLRIEIVKPNGEGRLAGAPQKGEQFSGLDILDMTMDSVPMAGNRTQLVYNYTFQAFEPGMQQLPALTYYSVANGAIDSAKTAPLEIKVFAVDVDSLKTINPDAPVVTIKKRMVDYVPDFVANYWWAWLLGILLVGGGLAVWYLIAKKGRLKRLAQVFVKPPEPPYDRAIRRLNEIRDQRLAMSGNDKHYFTELTDVLRIYLHGRYGIYAMEMTSKQILEAMEADERARQFVGLIEPVLQMSDSVKFAKMTTTPDENAVAYRDVRRMVEDSKPVEEVKPDNRGAVKSAAKSPAETQKQAEK